MKGRNESRDELGFGFKIHIVDHFVVAVVKQGRKEVAKG